MRLTSALLLLLCAAPALALDDPNATGHVLEPSALTQPKGSVKVTGFILGLSVTGAPHERVQLTAGIGTPPTFGRFDTGALASAKVRWFDGPDVKLAVAGYLEAHGRFAPSTVSFRNGAANAGIEQVATFCFGQVACTHTVTVGLGLASSMGSGPLYGHGAAAASVRALDHLRLSAEVHFVRPLSGNDRLPSATHLPWGTHVAVGVGFYGKRWALDAGMLGSVLASGNNYATPLLSFTWLWR